VSLILTFLLGLFTGVVKHQSIKWKGGVLFILVMVWSKS
jgi:hypothetical protein